MHSEYESQYLAQERRQALLRDAEMIRAANSVLSSPQEKTGKRALTRTQAISFIIGITFSLGALVGGLLNSWLGLLATGLCACIALLLIGTSLLVRLLPPRKKQVILKL